MTAIPVWKVTKKMPLLPCSGVTHGTTEDAQTQTEDTHVAKIESGLEQPIHSAKWKS